MSTPEKGLQTLSQLRTLLQSLADQLDDSDDDRVAMSRDAHGKMVPAYVVAQSAQDSEKASAAEIIGQVLGIRLESIRSALEVVDGLTAELAAGPLVDYKQIKFAGLDELIAGAGA